MAEAGRIALVLAAHGDRGSIERNAVLRRHADALRGRGLFKAVRHGVLNGEPALIDALREAGETGPSLVLIYPFFMSGGYFVRKVLPRRAAEAALCCRVRVLEPLGADPALPGLLVRRSLAAARGAGLEPETSRLVIAAHGSKLGRAPRQAAEAVADAVRAGAAFSEVTAAFIEESPFIADVLRAGPVPTVVAGLFSGEGMHGHDGLGAALAQAHAPCVYTRPIGGDPEIAALIEAAALRAMHSPLA